MDKNTGNNRCTPHYGLLDAGRIERIHTATLELLETVGVKVRHEAALCLLADAGCHVSNDHRVRIPARIVETAIETAPSCVSIYDRCGKQAMRLEGRNIHFGMGTDLAETYDLTTGKRRPSLLSDVVTAARIGDALSEIDFIASSAIPTDVSPNMMYLEAFGAELENSGKPIFFTAAGSEDLHLMYEMASTVAGGADELRRRPFLIHYAEPLSPLTHSRGAVDKLFFCADRHIPITYTPGMMSGATAPATLAGAIVMGNAEALSGLVMHQLKSKGAPIVSGFGMATFDMRRATCIYGCPEYRLIVTACADLYHHYGLPMWGTAGVTDANALDQQAGMEWGVSIMINAMAGANLIHDVGYMGQGLIGHPAALVACDEIIGYVKRFLRGFELDDPHLAVETIRQVGPGGNFLSARHTASFFKQEHWYPELCNRLPMGQWTAEGRKDFGVRAVEKAREILKSHKPPPLPDTVVKDLKNIRKRAESSLSDVHFVT